MKALSLLQPWASYIMIGLKKIETRSWLTTYRGPLAIHASTKLDPTGRDVHKHICALYPWVARLLPDFNALPRSAVLGVVELVSCSPTRFYIPEPAEQLVGDFTAGRYRWHLKYVVRLADPVYCKGALSLWQFTVPLMLREPLANANHPMRKNLLLDPRQCCKRDTDMDGICDQHP